MADKIKQKDQKTGGKIEPKNAGPDTPGFSSTDEENFFDKDLTIFFNQFLGQDKPKTEDAKYPESPGVEKSKAKKLEDVRKKVAPSGDKPTTAAAKKGTKDLPKAVKEVDPQNQAQQLPQLYQNMSMIMGIMSMGAGLGGGSGGGNSGFTVTGTPSGMSIVLTDGFVGALAILVKKFGFERVIKMFVLITLPNGGLQQLDSWYQPIVIKAISALLKVAIYYGPLNIPVSSYDETYYGDIVPTNLVTLESVPDFYQKQYYGSPANEPYPGYDQWIDPNDLTATKYYVRRELGTYTFASAQEEIYSTVERGIAADLDKYFYVDPTQYTISQGADPLFPRYLNDVLDKWIKQIEVQQGNLVIGNNAGGGGGNNMAAMMGMLIGLLMQLITMFQQEQIGSKNGTVASSTASVMEDFQKQMGMNNQILQVGMQALGGGGLGGALGGIGSLAQIGGMGGFGTLGGILGGGDIGGMMGGLMGGFGNLGGGSGGGGGGAGSGFPDATIGGSGAWSESTNSGLSNTEITDMQTLLTLLGIETTNGA